MDYMSGISAGLATCTWQSFLFLGLGVFIGVAFGSTPGLTGGMAIALVLPFTFYLSSVPAIGLLLGIYGGAMFGGAISAVTFGVPGTPEASADVYDGYKIAKAGKPYRALNTALYSSVSGQFLGALVAIFTFIPLANVALKFGPRELFSVMVFALATVVAFAGTSLLRGFIGAAIGALIAVVGPDPIMQFPRLSFGVSALESGIRLMPFLVGLFAMSELMIQFAKPFSAKLRERAKMDPELMRLIKKRSPDDRMPLREYIKLWREVLIGFVAGTIVGAIPGPGSTMAAFGSYAFAGNLKKNRGTFGTGNPGGLAAPEAGNSATCGPTLIPLFAFGIPGSAMAALFIGAFMMQGLTPGPGLMQDHMPEMIGIFIMLLVGCLFNLVISKWVMIPVFARMGLVESRLLIPILMPLVIIGVYAYNLRMFDVIIMAGAGVLGVLMRRFKIPLGTCLVAYILEPLAEKNFRIASIIAPDWTYWFTSPISIALYVIAAVTMAYFIISHRGQSASPGF